MASTKHEHELQSYIDILGITIEAQELSSQVLTSLLVSGSSITPVSVEKVIVRLHKLAPITEMPLGLNKDAFNKLTLLLSTILNSYH